MSKSDPLRLADYLSHIIQAVERIQSYVKDMDEAAVPDRHQNAGRRGS